MTENNMLPTALLEEIHSLKENMERITDFILELKQDYAVLEEKIELNSSDVLRLLGISRASLARWRDSKVVSYRYVSCNYVVYPFKGLYIAIKTGRASLQRLSQGGSPSKAQCLQRRYIERLYGRLTNFV